VTLVNLPVEAVVPPIDTPFKALTVEPRAWLVEPKIISPDIYNIKKVQSKFDYIFTHDKKLLNFIKKVYSYYSGYAHSDGLSGAQIVTANKREDQINMVELHMSIVMILLSKMIINYSDLFPEAKMACDKKSETFLVAKSITTTPMILP